jgi:DNA-directed RNA polymerase specialized sigma24 family protein
MSAGAGVSAYDMAARCRACSALGLLMAEDARNAPVWWDREFDSSGRQIRADVRAAAHEIWPNACRHARSLLGDVSDAAELMEQSVAQVSQYLDRASANPFSQNTRGILMCAFCRALRRYATKLNRLQLVGKSAELSERVRSPGWAALVDLQLDLEKLGCDLSDKGLKMLGLRRRGFEWKEIADALHMSETAARTAFWREIRRATSKNLDRDSGKNLPRTG